jgi:hypothetical protein
MAYEIEELKLSAVNFGLDPQWVADILAKWGAPVLALVVEALRIGFTQSFVLETLARLGPLVLELIVLIFNQKNMKFTTSTGEIISGDVVIGEEAGILVILIEKYLPVMVEKYLPIIANQLPAIIEQHTLQIVDLFTKYLLIAGNNLPGLIAENNQEISDFIVTTIISSITKQS